jgi:putative transposase
MYGLFRNKYRIGSDRYRGYDYSLPGAYYITICTKNKIHYFGDIENGRMIFSEIGKIANDEWLRTPEIRADMNITIGDYVIMPDHIHGIITIGENQYNIGKNDHCGVIRRDAMHCVSTKIIDKMLSMEVNSFGPQSKNMASIIRGFKSVVTKRACQIDPGFAWQPRFYDHIIRTNADLKRIRNYIRDNPNKWNNP